MPARGEPYVAPALLEGRGLESPSNFTDARWLSGPDFVYSREALEAGVAGRARVKCIITSEGTTQDCRVLVGLSHLDGAVLEALSRSRFSPTTYGGVPVAADYEIDLRVDPPPPAAAAASPDASVTSTLVGTASIVGLRRGTLRGVQITHFRAISSPPVFVPGLRAARAQGIAAVDCLLTREGAVKDCQTILAVSGLEQAVISALEHVRISPWLINGTPATLRFVFKVRVKPPPTKQAPSQR